MSTILSSSISYPFQNIQVININTVKSVICPECKAIVNFDLNKCWRKTCKFYSCNFPTYNN